MAQASQYGFGPLDGLANDIKVKERKTKYLSTDPKVAVRQTATKPLKTPQILQYLPIKLQPKTASSLSAPELPAVNLEYEYRVLILHRGSVEEAVYCSVMKVFSGERKHPYMALSHVWGPESANGKVWIRNCIPFQGPRTLRHVVQHVIRYRKQLTARMFPVRPNLYSALRQLRQPDQDRYLWVDALCIDRDNPLELNMQVQLMADIYQGAEEVLVWLGEGDLNNDTAFNLIHQNLDPIRDFTLSQRSILLDLMRNRWFTRLWNIQELALAKKAILQCGTESITWTEFVKYVDRFTSKFDALEESLGSAWERRQYQSTYLTDMRFSQATLFVNLIPMLFVKSDDGGIVTALREIKTLVPGLAGLQVSDPRDTIYALLSVASDTRKTKEEDSKGPQLRPDYRKSYVEVCIEFCYFCIQTSGSLDIICRPWALDVGLPMPSWIPLLKNAPFGVTTPLRKDRVNGEILAELSYNACKGIKAKARMSETERAELERKRPVMPRLTAVPTPSKDLEFSEDLRGRYLQLLPSKTLNVNGVEFDAISHVSPRVMAGVIPRECLQLCDNNRNDEFWRTMVADRDAEGEPAPDWYKTAFFDALTLANGNGDLDTTAIIAERSFPRVAQYLERVQSVVWNRRLGKLSTSGRLALLPAGTETGDLVCVLLGCSVPVVLRAQESKGSSNLVLVGECYVHGIMDGEALEYPPSRWTEYELQ